MAQQLHRYRQLPIVSFSDLSVPPPLPSSSRPLHTLPSQALRTISYLTPLPLPLEPPPPRPDSPQDRRSESPVRPARLPANE